MRVESPTAVFLLKHHDVVVFFAVVVVVVSVFVLETFLPVVGVLLLLFAPDTSLFASLELVLSNQTALVARFIVLSFRRDALVTRSSASNVSK